MAVALEKLEDQLNCSICLETYTNPKQLQCHHVYCQQCLVRLVVQDQQGQLSLTCPNCRQVTPVPASGVAGLQTAFQINKFLEIVTEHKKAGVATAGSRSASGGVPPSETISVCCPEHGGKEVALYCETCEKTICWKCIKNGEKHHSHKYEELDEAFERYKGEIMSSLEPLEEQLATVKITLEQFDTHHDEISNQKTSIENDINKAFTQLHEALDVRKTKLISQLHKLTQAKLKSLAAQRDQLEYTQAQLSSCLLFMRENLKTDNHAEALLMKSTTVRQVKELTTTFQPDLLKPRAEVDITFSSLVDLTAEIKNYGNVHAASLPDPSKCFVTGPKEDIASVGVKLTLILQILNGNNEMCKVSLTSIMCELISELTDARLSGIIESRGQSQYDISFQPTIKGRHQLHIRVEGAHIRGSPFPVSVRAPAEQLGTPILTIDGLNACRGIAVNQRGEMVVAEMNSNCVTVFSPKGERVRSFGTEGADHGQFRRPLDVAVDSDDNILVCDYTNCRIQKFTGNGEFCAAVDTEGRAISIAFSARNRRVYTCLASSHILILNSDLSYYSTFGAKGSGKGQFYTPMQICCDSTGNVYVTDFNHRIQVFTAEGEFLRMFGRRELHMPRGIVVDSSDKVYVCDSSRVVVFTHKGEFLTSFGSLGEGPGQFKDPYGIDIDSCGIVYVSDNSNRIRLF